MATITTRAAKGSALTFTEVDDNFTNLNSDGISNTSNISNLQNDKLDKSGGTVTGTLNVNSNLTTGAKLIGSTGNNSQSGSAVTLSGVSTEFVRLTNSSLVSVAGVDSGVSGQKLVLSNKTGTSITILNDSSSAISNAKLFTGTGSDLILQSEASVSFVYDSTSQKWNLVGGTGSGSTSSGINYILNSDASIGTTGWNAYADAAGAQPVDGTGGSPAAGLWIRSTTTPLRGSGDFNLVKTGSVSYQGQGVSYDFTIDNADLAKVLTVSFDYEVLSGTYANGDLTVYLIQDPAGTPLVIQPAGYTVLAGTVGTKLKQIATFQTDSAIKTYRLCFHIASTSALDYSLAIDSVVVGPQVVQYGAPVTDWVSYTPTIGSSTGSVTNATASGRYRRVGDTLFGEVAITFSSTSAAFTNPNITLPSGLSVDLSKIPADDTDRPCGITSCLDSGLTAYGPWYASYNSTLNRIQAVYSPIVNATSASTVEPVKGVQITNTFPFTFNTSDRIYINFSVPILGWSSTVQMSNDTDTRVVSLMVTNTGASTTSVPTGTAGTKVLNLSVNVDTHGAWSVANQEYTVPVSGYYDITTSVFTSGFSSGVDVGIIRNSTYFELTSFTQTTAQTVIGNTCLFLSAGDKISLGTYQTSGSTQNYGAYNPTRLKLTRVSGPSAIASSETVAARYTSTAGTTVPTGGLGAGLVPVPFATKDYDSHGFFNGSTGVGTIPISGVYRISSSAYFPSLSWTAFGKAIWIRKNGSSLAVITSYTPASASTTDLFLGGSVELRFNAGDTFDLNLFHNESSTRTLSTLAGATQITIVRIGN